MTWRHSLRCMDTLGPATSDKFRKKFSSSLPNPRGCSQWPRSQQNKCGLCATSCAFEQEATSRETACRCGESRIGTGILRPGRHRTCDTTPVPLALSAIGAEVFLTAGPESVDRGASTGTLRAFCSLYRIAPRDNRTSRDRASAQPHHSSSMIRWTDARAIKLLST